MVGQCCINHTTLGQWWDNKKWWDNIVLICVFCGLLGGCPGLGLYEASALYWVRHITTE